MKCNRFLIGLIIALIGLTACHAGIPDNSNSVPVDVQRIIQKLWDLGIYQKASAGYDSLSEKELEDWNLFFLPDFSNHFLLSNYSDPADINLYPLLSDASIGGESIMVLTEKEIALLETKFPHWKNRMPEIDVFKVKASYLDEQLIKYLGIPLSSTNKIGFRLDYLEETDYYYGFLSETTCAKYEILEGVKVQENLILLHWKIKTALSHLCGAEGMVLLQDNNSGWNILMNKSNNLPENYLNGEADSAS